MRKLSEFNLIDEASLRSFMDAAGFELVSDCGTLKAILNPGSDFTKRVAYIRNCYSDVLSKECPAIIYRYLESENFKV